MLTVDDFFESRNVDEGIVTTLEDFIEGRSADERIVATVNDFFVEGAAAAADD